MAARKTVTVVFCDIVDSTPIAERLDPEVHRRVMDRYFEALRTPLEHHGGTVEKFIGDAVMAVFGIPVAHDDDALRALRAAADMRVALAEMNEQLERDFGVTIAIRTGVNTGEVVAGDHRTGSAFATGDTAGTAQRLEAAARAGEILVGDATYRLVSNAVLVEPVEALTLKGKARPVDAWRLLGVVEGAPPFVRRMDAPMVGRQAELDRLREEFDRAVREQSLRLATVVGPAGIGKSRLANELVRTVGDEANALVGRCLAYGEGITYWPLRGLVLSAVGDLTPEGIERAIDGVDDAARIADNVAGAVGTGPSAGGSEETFWAVRRLLEHLAQRQPLVVGIDELQWAEPDFLDLIEYLAGWSRGAPILVLCLSRPELLEKRPSWGVTLSLEPLSEHEAEELVEVMGGDRMLDEAERARITAAAEGNPLFLEQLLALKAELGAREVIPPSIHALLVSRLDALESEERSVLERASVIGREFSRGAIGTLSGEDVGATLLSLARKDLVEPDLALFPWDDGFRFRHILIRDAAYLGLAKETRADIHEGYAAWLQENAGEGVAEFDEILGYHLEQAFRLRQELGTTDPELRERAGKLLAGAGRRAIGRGDVPATVTLLARAVALLPDSNDERREMLPLLGSALMRTGEFARAERVLDEALESAKTAGDRRLELRTLIEREFFRAFTNPDESVEDIVAVADSAIPLLEELGDDIGLAKAWWLKSEVHLNAFEWAARTEHLERALAHARRAGDAGEQATIAAQLAQAVYYGPAPATAAIARCEELLRDVPSTRSLRASVIGSLAGLRAMQGDFEEARRLQEEAREIWQELGQRFRIAMRSLMAADIELLADRPDEATAVLRWAYSELSAMGAQSVIPPISAFLADALCEEGEFEEAARFARLARDGATPVDVVAQVMWRVALARATRDTGLAREAVALAERTDSPDLKARAYAAAGDLRAAQLAYESKGNVAAATRLLARQMASS
jgi:class 3 adenylate cyclase/tetratricopeptide (TPR) repeat protein